MRLSNGSLAGNRVQSTLPLPSGGQMLFHDISANGTMICASDQYTPWKKRPGSDTWEQLFIPGKTFDESKWSGVGSGTWAVAVCRSNPLVMLAACMESVWTTVDGGANWTWRFKCAASIHSDDDRKMIQRRAAIDPVNPLIMAIGLPGSDGFKYTTDGGTTWARNTSIPLADASYNSGGVIGVCADPHSPVVNGQTQVWAGFSSGGGLWRLPNGVASTAVQLTNDTSIGQMDFQPTTGRLYFVGKNQSSDGKSNPGGSTIRYVNAGSTTVNTIAGTDGRMQICCDPTSSKVWACSAGGGLSGSADGLTFTAEAAPNRTAPDAPYMAWTHEFYMKAGMMMIDPSTGDLIFGEGIGMWKWPSPKVDGSVPTYIAVSRGIENMVGTCVDSDYRSGTIVLSIHDRRGFSYLKDQLDYWQQRHDTEAGNPAICHSNSASFATDDPNWVVRMAGNVPWQSSDAGRNWTPMVPIANEGGTNRPSPALPGNVSDRAYCGNLVAFTKGRALLISQGARPMFFNQGAVGVSDFGSAANAALQYRDGSGDALYCKGLFDAYYLHRVMVAVDMANPGTATIIWAHGGNDADATQQAHSQATQGVWRTTDYGEHFTRIRSTPVNGGGDYYKMHFKQVPGFPNHYFIAFGDAGDPAKGLMFSKDGCVTWAPVPGLPGYCDGVGFGTNLPGASYPRIVVSSQGLRECLNFNPDNLAASTFTNINGERFPGGMHGEITSIGDTMAYPFGTTLLTSGPSGGYMQRYNYRMTGV